MYCYHVWETRHPRLLNGEPLYEMDIYSKYPIRNQEQIKECLKTQSIWYELLKDKEYEVIPMSTICFIFNMIKDAIIERFE